MIVCSRCRKNRKHHSKGLCRSCYGAERTKDIRVHCLTCGRDNMPYAGKNICRSCSVIKSRKKDHENWKKKHAKVEKERRKRLGDVYRERDRERNKSPKRILQKKINARAWQDNNKGHVREYRKTQRIINPSAIKASEQNRRARHKNAGYLSTKEWKEILDKYNHSCYYCRRDGIPLEQEHKTPLVRGGKHSKDNVVPACRSCNARKGKQTEEEFKRSL